MKDNRKQTAVKLTDFDIIMVYQTSNKFLGFFLLLYLFFNYNKNLCIHLQQKNKQFKATHNTFFRLLQEVKGLKSYHSYEIVCICSG